MNPIALVVEYYSKMGPKRKKAFVTAIIAAVGALLGIDIGSADAGIIESIIGITLVG